MQEIRKIKSQIELHSYLPRRLFSLTKPPTKTLFEAIITPINKLHTLGSQYMESKLNSITNIFWKDTLSSWTRMCPKLEPRNYEDLYSFPLWFNQLISKDPFFIPNLDIKGIKMIGDLLQNGGTILSKQNLIEKNRSSIY